MRAFVNEEIVHFHDTRIAALEKINWVELIVSIAAT
jgi:hypothetical protein